MPDRVVGQHRLEVVDPARHDIDEALQLLDPALGQIPGDAANSREGGHHPNARVGLVEIEDKLAITPGVEETGVDAEIEAGGAQPELVARDPRQLHHQDPDRLRPGRDLHADQLFDGHHEPDVVDGRRQVIHSVAEGDALGVGLLLEGFLEPGVEIAHVRVGIAYPFAVQLQAHPEDAVRARVLGSHVELDPIGLSLVLRAERLLGRTRPERLLRGAWAERFLCDAGLSHGSHRAPALRASGR